MDISNIINSELSRLNNQGYNVAYICSFGSYNYGLAINTKEYQSDLDLVAVIIPTLDNLIDNTKYISFKYNYEFGEVLVKDIRLFINEIMKASPSAIECLFAQYGYSSKNMATLINSKDNIVKNLEKQYFTALYHMFKSNMEKVFDSSLGVNGYKRIEEFGYDGKRAVICLRLSDMVDRYFNDDGSNLSNCFMCIEPKLSKFLGYKMQKGSIEDLRKDLEDSKRLIENNKNLYFNDVDVMSDLNLQEFSKQMIKNTILDKIGEIL